MLFNLLINILISRLFSSLKRLNPGLKLIPTNINPTNRFY